MKNIKVTLFLASVIAISATSAFADGQIPIGGRPTEETVKTTTAPSFDSVVGKNDEDDSSQIKDYLWTFFDFIGQF
jgi:hypothetical protein